MMKKNIKLVLMGISVFLLINVHTVNASSYLNKFGVNIEQSIYEELLKYYDKDYIESIT